MDRTGIGIALLISVAASAMAAPRAGALADEAAALREDQLKAAYLFNFVKFVEWPAADADKPLTVCFMGGAGIHYALASGIESKKVGNRPLTVKRLEPTESVGPCSVLYIDSTAISADQRLRLDASKHPMLTVSDIKRFMRSGGIIELFTDNNRLRFSVNVGNAQKAGLRISSSLLQLAAAVEMAGTT